MLNFLQYLTLAAEESQSKMQQIVAAEPSLPIMEFAKLSTYQQIAVALLLFSPGAIAIFATITFVIVLRRIRRASHEPPFKPWHLFFITIGSGAAFGVLALYTFDRLIYQWLLGVPPLPELYVAAIAFTGFASIGFYELLRWYCVKKEYWGLYELISVKHRSTDGDCGDSPRDDLTRIRR